MKRIVCVMVWMLLCMTQVHARQTVDLSSASGRPLDQNEAAAPPELETHWRSRDVQPLRDWLSSIDEARANQRDALLIRARLARADGDTDSAAKLVEQALAMTPESSTFYSRLILERATSKLDGLDEAGMFSSLRIARSVRDDFEKAFETDPGYVRAQLGLLQFHTSAPAIAGGRDARAEQMRTLLSVSAPNELAVFDAARLAGKGESGAALERIESIAGDRVLADPYWILIKATLLQDLGRYVQAGEMLDQALDRFPLHAGLWYQRGRVSAESGRDAARGLEAMLRYLELPRWPGDPELAAVWWRIGQLQLALGREEGAREAWEYSLVLNPDFEQSTGALEALDQN